MPTIRSRYHGHAKNGTIQAYMMADGRKELKTVHLEYRIMSEWKVCSNRKRIKTKE
jgi:hypothetical protein